MSNAGRSMWHQEPEAHSMFPGEGGCGDENGSLRKLGSEGVGAGAAGCQSWQLSIPSGPGLTK